MSNIKPLSILQKRSVRIIHKADSREHTNRQFFKSGLLKLKEIAELQTSLVMHKATSRMLPVYLQQLFAFGSDKEDHRRKCNCKHPYARTTQANVYFGGWCKMVELSTKGSKELFMYFSVKEIV